MAAEPVVVLVGTLDTKRHELEYMRARVREAGAARRRDDVRRDHPGGHGHPGDGAEGSALLVVEQKLDPRLRSPSASS